MIEKRDCAQLTDAQLQGQFKMYVAAVRIANRFCCDAIGIQYQQGLKDMAPASDLVEGLLNNPDRPPVYHAETGYELYAGLALPHFNEVDECAAVDALVTNRVWTALGFEPSTTLHGLLEADDLEASYRIMAALHLLKIGAIQLAELDPELQEMLRTLTPNGFRLLCGPEPAFSGVWNTLTNQCVPLRIRVLGQKEVVLNGQSVQLSERALETLVLLALYPDGLTPETLHTQLYESEEIKLSALRVAVSRLRPLVPISAQPGLYRIAEAFSFDVHDCEKAIDAGDVRAALEIYRGPLLENSDAPGIREARLNLEEKLRQSALSSGDASVLLPLAETMRDDLELWEAAHAALPVNDARLPLVRAQLRRVTQDIHPTYN